MQTRRLITVFKQALAALGLALLLAACGGGGGAQLAPELVGSWNVVEVEIQSMVQPCPGEIPRLFGPVKCGTTVVSFNADGTFVSVDSADERGDPISKRSEGTWSTGGNTLTRTETLSGPDAANLVPTDPPALEKSTWSISANRLTLTTSYLFGDVTYRLQKR